ncbi:MAG: hypothetical protein ACYCSF_07335 [Acidimicrobiales bacterium]
MKFEEQGARQRYSISCPHCHSEYEQTIKPGLDDPGFLEEYRNEVRLVAFDMLVNHLIGEHEEASTGFPPSPVADPHSSAGDR